MNKKNIVRSYIMQVLHRNADGFMRNIESADAGKARKHGVSEDADDRMC